MTTATLIRRHREALSLTREDAARRAGISTSTLARFELSGDLPRLDQARRLADVLGIDAHDLLNSAAVKAA